MQARGAVGAIAVDGADGLPGAVVEGGFARDEVREAGGEQGVALGVAGIAVEAGPEQIVLIAERADLGEQRGIHFDAGMRARRGRGSEGSGNGQRESEGSHSQPF